MFQRTTDNMKEACGIMYGKMEKSLKLLRRIYFVEIIVLLIVGGIVGVFMSLYAAPNKSFVYQGRITGADFLPLDDGTYYMRIKLFDASTGGTCQWSTGADRTGANCAAANSAANVPIALTRSLFSIPMGDTAYHANMPNIASLDFKNTTYFMDVSFSTASGGTYETFTTRTKLGSAASAITVLDALQANTSNQVPGSYTQINDADGITVSDATITVDSTAGYPSAGTLLIDTEVMTYTTTTTTTFTGVVRGTLGTTAATHADNATIKTYLFSGAASTASTTLASDPGAAGTTITVGSTAGYPSSGAIRIENELITYSGTNSTQFTGATRGARGTTGATHAAGTTVKLDLLPTFFITSDGSAFINTNSTTVNPQVGFQVSGTTNYTLGIDRIADSTANKFKISTNNVAATGTGTISSVGTTVTGVGTAFTTQISVGSTITASGQTRTVASITSNTILDTDTAFSPAIAGGTSFTFINTLLTLDSRNTLSAGQYSTFTFNGLNNTLASSASADYTTLTVTPPIITLSGSTQVLSVMDSIFFGRPTIASIAQGITDAATFTVAGPPLLTAGVMTNAYAVKVNSLTTNGGATPTNAYGLAVAAPTGATNNYSAIFTGGNVGIGTTAPITQLHVAGSVPSAAHASVTQAGAGFSSIFIQGRYLYATGQSTDRLYIYDVSKLGVASPALNLVNAGGTTTADQPQRVSVQGRYAYILNLGTDTLQVFDISNPAAPTQVTTGNGVATLGGPNSIRVQGRYAYVVSTLGGRLEIFDISNPTSPTVVNTGGLALGASPNSIAVQGRYAYVSNSGAATFQIIDVSNPASLAITSTVTVVANANSIGVQGRYAYVASSPNQTSAGTLQVFDISNPASVPAAIGTVATGNNPTSEIFIQGRYLFLNNPGDGSSAGTLQTFDISNPASPASVGTVATGTFPVSPVVSGRYVFVPNFTSNTIQVFDIGGSYIQQVEVGGLEIATGQVRSNFTINNSLDVRGGVNIGTGGLYSAGPLSINGLEGASGTNAALDIRSSDGTSVLFVQNSGKIGLVTTTPSYDLSFGAAQRTIGIESQTGNNAGNNLLLLAGNAGSSADLAGGNLLLQSGGSRGTGTSKIQISVPQASASGTTNNSPSVMFEFVNGHIASLADNGTTAMPRVNNLAVCTNGLLGTAATLNGSHNSSITTITVNSTTDYPTSGTLIISNEIMTYTGTTATTFTGVTRGQNGTTAATQSDGASVRLYPASTDVSGKVIFTGASTACTLEFAKAFTSAPSCVASYEDLDSSGAVTVRTTAITTTSVSFALNGTTSANDKLSYFCIGLGSQ